MNGYEKGAAFEQYVKDVMFPDKYYSIVRETPKSDQLNERFVEDALLPDFTFRRKTNDFTFFVEAKYRSFESLTTNYMLEFCSEQQYLRYRKANQKHPLFIALGVGGKPSSPSMIFLFHFEQTSNNQTHFPSLCEKAWFYKNKRVFSWYLKDLAEIERDC